MRALRHEVSVQDCLDHRLQTDALAHDLVATRHLPTKPHRLLIGHPHLRQEPARIQARSEEHTSELQSLMRISYAVFCLKKTKQKIHHTLCIVTTYHTLTDTQQPII